ncbi:transketolase [Bordetella avium]|uniref:Transketolase N-terminal part n=1 Tax=Bordetella avium (strain 197N) TaxID=360910 RepID=Q2L331_BORA1|nr:transketolase [Bordetella avium]AZY48732.1 transketolase [Bordetella avium]AZY52111.1 transketolase [Bordetella avium]RIQ14038.1 transketolase [Bordetella avium]RIQ39737.1 transketolase [Bordetella avium]RIQ44535.1 transketolase [Bordetella avium]
MTDLSAFSKQIRLRVLELCSQKRTSHIGGAFSIADVLAVLYGAVLDVRADAPDEPSRDRLLYSKGHACTALYAALEHRGFFEGKNLLEEFTENGSYFTSHVNHRLPGVELSTGSLGHALGVACGSALACKRRQMKNTVFAILSDGELDEGSNWEAILFAAHNRLDNLVAVIDFNKIQSFGSVKDVMNLEPLADKFRAFNWEVEEVDGHSLEALQATLRNFKSSRSGRPKCLIAHTIKGKGVSFMENELVWHYRSPSDQEVQRAREELESA